MQYKNQLDLLLTAYFVTVASLLLPVILLLLNFKLVRDQYVNRNYLIAAVVMG